MADLPDITAAIYARLIAYAPLTVLVPVPAIVSGFFVPPGSPLPRVNILTDAVSDISTDDTTNFLREQVRDVFVYSGRGKTGTASEVPIGRIAEAVRSALHLFYLPLIGWKTVIAQASGPRNAPTDETVAGRVITVRYLFSEA